MLIMANMLTIMHEEKTWAIRVLPRSDAKEYVDRKEEDLHFGAVECFNEVYTNPFGLFNKSPGLNSAMIALPYIAKYYEVDRNLITANWIRHYGPFYL
jgi:hypothetical protein